MNIGIYDPELDTVISLPLGVSLEAQPKIKIRGSEEMQDILTRKVMLQEYLDKVFGGKDPGDRFLLPKLVVEGYVAKGSDDERSSATEEDSSFFRLLYGN